MLEMLYVCLWSWMRVVCISSVGSCGILACISAVVFVKGMDLCISVMRPPPPRVSRSCLSVVYPGNFGVNLPGVSLVS